ncbi:hypothetical protein FO519_007143 [Halicephalobus sp. NKZ332]|nr:hypothetical protein FO519_007143 [Halicephalobus sp. NKZ332]
MEDLDYRPNIEQRRPKRWKFLVTIVAVAVLVLLCIGTILAIVLSTRHKSKNHESPEASTTPFPSSPTPTGNPPTEPEVILTISLCTASNEGSRRFNRTSGNLMSNFAIVYAPYSTTPQNITKYYTDVLEAVEELNNLLSSGPVISQNPNQTANVERFHPDNQYIRVKRALSPTSLLPLFHFTPSRRLYSSDSAMYEDMQTAGDILNLINPDISDIIIVGVDLDQQELSHFALPPQQLLPNGTDFAATLEKDLSKFNSKTTHTHPLRFRGYFRSYNTAAYYIIHN